MWTKVWGFGAKTNLAEALQLVLAECSKGSQVFHEVQADHGVAEIVCRLDGGTHQGTTIAREALTQLTTLGLDLGIEVFPDGLGDLCDDEDA